MSNVETWDVAAANNNSASPDGWPENMPFAGVNNSARENMAAVARRYRDTRGDLLSGGAANTLTLTSLSTYASLLDGLNLRFQASASNTGAATLNVDALGAQSIVRPNGDALEAGDIVANGIYDVVYDLTNTRWVLLGSAPVVTQATKRLTSTTRATLASTGHAMQVGASTAANLRMDQAGLQAVDNGAAVPMELQAAGGDVSVGDPTANSILYGQTRIQALLVAAAAILRLQPSGSTVRIGNTGAVDNLDLGDDHVDALNNGVASQLDLNPSGGAVVSGGAFSAPSVAATAAVTGATMTATGAISGASVAATGAVTGATMTATGRVSGQMQLTMNYVDGSSEASPYTLNNTGGAEDNFAVVMAAGGGNQTIDLPATDGDWPIGSFVIIREEGGNQVTVTVDGGSGTLVGSATIASGGSAMFWLQSSGGGTTWVRLLG